MFDKTHRPQFCTFAKFADIWIYSDRSQWNIKSPPKKLGRDDTVEVSATNGLGALKSRGLHPALVFLSNHRLVTCSLRLNLLT